MSGVGGIIYCTNTRRPKVDGYLSYGKVHSIVIRTTVVFTMAGITLDLEKKLKSIENGCGSSTSSQNGGKLCPSQSKSSIGNRLKTHIQQFNPMTALLSCVPLIHRLQCYNWKTDFASDIIAGFTVVILQIPQGIAYALLVGVGPNFGLYTSFFPPLIYSFLGTAQHLSFGTIAVVDLMLRDTVKKYLPWMMEIKSMSNSSVTPPIFQSPEDEASMEILTSLCLLVGIFQMMFGFLQLGSLSLILSEQLISGFSTAASVNVILSQVPAILQVSVEKKGGLLSLPKSVVDIIMNIPRCQLPTVLLSIIVFLCYVVYKSFFEDHLRKKLPFPFPFDLLVVILSTAISYGCNLSSSFGIVVMGKIPRGLPSPQVPRIDLFPTIIVDALVLAIMCFSISLSLGRIYGKRHKYHVRPNQELFAQGAANTFASFFLCFPAAASLSRSSIMGQHAKSQLASLVSCVILLLILLFLAPLLTHTPKAAIGVIIIVAQKSMVMQFGDFVKYWKVSKWEGLIWLVTFSSVILLGLDIGLGVGVFFSILTVVMRFYSPQLKRMGQLTDSDAYVDIENHERIRELPGIVILQFQSPLFFLNKDTFKEMIKKRMSESSNPLDTLILDCSGITFIDSTGVDVIVDLAKELSEGVRVCLCSCSFSTLSTLDKMEFSTKSPETRIFPSILEAVRQREHIKLCTR